MRNLAILAVKLLNINRRRILSIALTLAIGLALSLALMNIGINGINKAVELTSGEESKTVVSLGKEYAASGSVKHGDIYLSNSTAKQDNSDNEIIVLEAVGEYFKSIAPGYYITEEFAYTLFPDNKPDAPIFTLNGDKISVESLRLPYGEIFGGILIIGNNAAQNGEKVASIDVFKDIYQALEYIKGANGIADVYGRAEAAAQTRTVYTAIFALFIVFSIIIIAIFFFTFVCKYKLYTEGNNYSFYVMRLLGYSPVICALLSLAVIVTIYLIALLVGLALLFAVNAILIAMNLTFNIINISELISVIGYTAALYFAPYLTYSAILTIAAVKRGKISAMGAKR